MIAGWALTRCFRETIHLAVRAPRVAEHIDRDFGVPESTAVRQAADAGDKPASGSYAWAGAAPTAMGRTTATAVRAARTSRRPGVRPATNAPSQVGSHRHPVVKNLAGSRKERLTGQFRPFGHRCPRARALVPSGPGLDFRHAERVRRPDPGPGQAVRIQDGRGRPRPRGPPGLRDRRPRPQRSRQDHHDRDV
jgi:hypothetical protein